LALHELSHMPAISAAIRKIEKNLGTPPRQDKSLYLS
jgi:hypothetical protein